MVPVMQRVSNGRLITYVRIDLPHVRMDIGVGRVRSTASVSIDPLEPVFGAIARREILEIVRGWDTW